MEDDASARSGGEAPPDATAAVKTAAVDLHSMKNRHEAHVAQQEANIEDWQAKVVAWKDKEKAKLGEEK